MLVLPRAHLDLLPASGKPRLPREMLDALPEREPERFSVIVVQEPAVLAKVRDALRPKALDQP